MSSAGTVPRTACQESGKLAPLTFKVPHHDASSRLQEKADPIQGRGCPRAAFYCCRHRGVGSQARLGRRWLSYKGQIISCKQA